ncbi:unnamed protein product [Brachionus calyciflorus]|uniref:SH3 domain-containing protein n=1 Tax=Brachionus calyciflorus TaxID=104777 RepID=A0A814DGI9_9BILA|nr:unnamed protein product [Brachionus calyciflorus]
MSKQMNKFIEKAKSKLCNGLSLNVCIKANQTSNESTYLPVTKVDFITPVKVQQTPVKVLKKSTATVNLFKKSPNKVSQLEQTTMNISQFPMLINSPEINQKVARTCIESSTIFTDEEQSPSMSGIYRQDSLETQLESTTSDYGSNLSSAFSNVMYESPQCQNHNSTRFSQMEQDSFGFISNDFHSANTNMFTEDIHESNELYVCCVSYSALNQSELSIEFSERLELIQGSEYKYKDFCLVKNVITNESGYVPKYSICLLSQFLSDMKILTD